MRRRGSLVAGITRLTSRQGSGARSRCRSLTGATVFSVQARLRRLTREKSSHRGVAGREEETEDRKLIGVKVVLGSGTSSTTKPERIARRRTLSELGAEGRAGLREACMVVDEGDRLRPGRCSKVGWQETTRTKERRGELVVCLPPAKVKALGSRCPDQLPPRCLDVRNQVSFAYHAKREPAERKLQLLTSLGQTEATPSCTASQASSRWRLPPVEPILHMLYSTSNSRRIPCRSSCRTIQRRPST